MQIHLAPMEGVVDYVTRALYSKIGGYDQFVTEFVRVTERVLPPKVFYRYCPELKTGGKTREGVPVYVQILGGTPTVIADNAALAVELGAPGIDLNFGCPAKTVNRHDGGAALLKKPSRLFDIISEVKKTVPPGTPVTAKVRLGFDHKDHVCEIAQAVDSAGADRLTVHARTKLEGYKPPAHWTYIAKMKEAVQRVPIVANGDIWSVQDYFECVRQTGIENIALGRPAIACPDLALQIKFASAGTHKNLLWPKIKGELLPQFVELNLEFRDEKYAVVRTKQWLKSLGRQYPEAKLLFENLKRLTEIKDITPQFDSFSAY